MKRDADLIRAVLLALEEAPGPYFAGNLEIDGYPAVDVSYHVMLLAEAGLIRAQDVSGLGEDLHWLPERLTWEGYEFLEAARNPTLWAKAKTAVFAVAGGLTMAALKTALDELVKYGVHDFLSRTQ